MKGWTRGNSLKGTSGCVCLIRCNCSESMRVKKLREASSVKTAQLVLLFGYFNQCLLFVIYRQDKVILERVAYSHSVYICGEVFSLTV